MYNYGTEARVREYLSDEDERAKEAEKRRQRLLAKRQRKMRAGMIKTLLIIVALLGVITAREAQITMLCGQISKLKADEENLSAVATEKEMHLTEALDLTTIEETAVSRLGMKKPDQYVEVSFEEKSGGEVLKDEDGPKGAFASLIGKVKVFLEYLY